MAIPEKVAAMKNALSVSVDQPFSMSAPSTPACSEMSKESKKMPSPINHKMRRWKPLLGNRSSRAPALTGTDIVFSPLSVRRRRGRGTSSSVAPVQPGALLDNETILTGKISCQSIFKASYPCKPKVSARQRATMAPIFDRTSGGKSSPPRMSSTISSDVKVSTICVAVQAQ
jgi:hypothetical protein